MKINCDIGERGADHPDDRELMRHIQIANIACGGHAGDTDSIAVFRALAVQHEVIVSAHLSYPDLENFGRTSLDISEEELCASLTEQHAKMADVSIVKFHGALYNDSVRDPALANTLTHWLLTRQVTTLITPADSVMAQIASSAGIVIWGEAFADRRYIQNESGQLQLLSRTHPLAVYETLAEALAQCHLLSDQRVTTHTGAEVSIQADTLCIHSDSAIALQLILALTLPFTLPYRGLCSFVRTAEYGGQSHGSTPGGPQDRFAFETGHALLNTGSRKNALEFIIPPIVHVTRPAYFVLTGARFKNVRMQRGDQTLPIPHATVFRAEPNDVLRFGQNSTGLRGYLCWHEGESPMHKTRPPLPTLITWREPHGRFRLLKGPEYDRLIRPEVLTNNPWIMGQKSDAMGLQLETQGLPLELDDPSMISAPVCDGTIQLTPTGPIVLMRHRQTIGGYPRIANVIEVDLDRLAQLKPGQVIRFSYTDLPTARALLEQRTAALSAISLHTR